MRFRNPSLDPSLSASRLAAPRLSVGAPVSASRRNWIYILGVDMMMQNATSSQESLENTRKIVGLFQTRMHIKMLKLFNENLNGLSKLPKHENVRHAFAKPFNTDRNGLWKFPKHERTYDQHNRAGASAQQHGNSSSEQLVAPQKKMCQHYLNTC